jgi:DNA-directed RNA polymerase subunit H (RpoH/RPB5)
MEADIELIVRSRPTIVEILENRGYDSSQYQDIAPEEIRKLAATNPDLLRIIVPKRADSVAGAERCIVLYWTLNAVRLKLESNIFALFSEENSTPYNKTDEFIVLLSEPYHEVFDLVAAKMWNMEKIRINFFHLKQIISNPSKHIMVPPHRKLQESEINGIIESLHVKTKFELGIIKYHKDIQTRVLGLVPGDVVEIKRPSETCGIYTLYRICTP